MERIYLWKPTLKNVEWNAAVTCAIRDVKKRTYEENLCQLVEELAELQDALLHSDFTIGSSSLYSSAEEEIADVMFSIAIMWGGDEYVDVNYDFPDSVKGDKVIESLIIRITTTVWRAMKSLRDDCNRNIIYEDLKVDMAIIQKLLHLLCDSLNYTSDELMDIMQYKSRRYFKRKFEHLKLDELPPRLERSFTGKIFGNHEPSLYIPKPKDEPEVHEPTVHEPPMHEPTVHEPPRDEPPANGVAVTSDWTTFHDI